MNREQAEQITTEYLKPLFGFALKKTANLQDAEDISQEIALKLYNALLTTDIENISAFVWRVAHNVLANYYRGRARSGVGVSLDDLSGILRSEDDTAKGYEQAETVGKLWSEIAYLSKIQRKAVVMYYYENKKQEEIA